MRTKHFLYWKPKNRIKSEFKYIYLVPKESDNNHVSQEAANFAIRVTILGLSTYFGMTPTRRKYLLELNLTIFANDILAKIQFCVFFNFFNGDGNIQESISNIKIRNKELGALKLSPLLLEGFF